MATKPFNETQRLAALKTYCPTEAKSGDYFDRLTKLACGLFNVPITLVSLVEAEQQLFRSQQGLNIDRTPREHAFCAYTILNWGPFVVADASTDPLFANNPLVTGYPHIRFYAGCPLVTSVGFRLGTFCLIDTEPRHDFDETQHATLENFAALAMYGLEAERERFSASGADEEDAAASQAQFDAITTVAHDIREPLGTIVSLANVMESETFGPLGDDRYQVYSSNIVRTGRYLADVARKILDVARLRTGDMEVNEEALDVSTLLGDAAALVSAQASRRSNKIVTRADSSGSSLCADRTYVLQMLSNLLSNAITFSSQGSHILVEARRRQGGVLELTVLDRGVGMSAYEVTHALKPFGQVGVRRQENKDGIGLGLTLVRQLIELHGGELLIESRKGAGTAATLRFPAYRLLEQAARASRVQVDAGCSSTLISINFYAFRWFHLKTC